jgi:hypothetical protein
VRPYTDAAGVKVQQSGLANAAATLAWVVQQQATGALATTFDNLVIMGEALHSLTDSL